MANIQPYRPSPVDIWRGSKSRSRMALSRDLTIAEIEDKADIDASVVDGIAYVGHRAMQNVALLSQLEQQLATAVPIAATRLQGIGDMTTLGMADVVAGTSRRLARR